MKRKFLAILLTWLGFAVVEQRGVHVDEEDHAAEVEVKVETFVERRRYVGGYHFCHGESDSHDDQQLSVKGAKSRRQGVAVQQKTEIVVLETWTLAACVFRFRPAARPFDFSPPRKLDYFRRLPVVSPVASRLRRRAFPILIVLPEIWQDRGTQIRETKTSEFFSFKTKKKKKKKKKQKKKTRAKRGMGKRRWRYHWPQIHPPP